MPMAMRLPMRRSAVTVRPSTLSSGGSTVRSRKMLTTRTRSSGWPSVRG